MNKGDLFTVNGRKAHNGIIDRSYSEHIWRVVEQDESHIWAAAEYGDFWAESYRADKPRGFVKRDFDFLPCSEEVLDNLKSYNKNPIAEAENA